MCGPPLDRSILPSYFSNRQSTNQNVSKFRFSLCATYSRLSLAVSILSLSYLFFNYFRLSNSLHPLFFVFFTPYFSDYLLSFPFIFFFSRLPRTVSDPYKRTFLGHPSKSGPAKKIKKKCYIFGSRNPLRIAGPR